MGEDQTDWFVERSRALTTNVELAFRGKPGVIRLALVCLFAEGHLLIEDVPGVGKTSLARAIAASIDGSWNRIQFTPDLLPSDVTGVTIFNQANQSFEFHSGPVFANLIVADEINRASPRTQSALLEVMDERRVTVDGTPHDVPRPFLVMATQNPVDMDGTYRLPEAQLDRFLIRTPIGYPSPEAEVEILETQRAGSVVDTLTTVLDAREVATMIEVAASIHVSPAIQRYIVDVIGALRVSADLRLAASPRASLALMRAARALAALDGHSYVVPEDIKELAVAVLSHRLMLTPEAEMQDQTTEAVVAAALESVAVPRSPAEV